MALLLLILAVWLWFACFAIWPVWTGIVTVVLIGIYSLSEWG